MCLRSINFTHSLIRHLLGTIGWGLAVFLGGHEGFQVCSHGSLLGHVKWLPVGISLLALDADVPVASLCVSTGKEDL